MSIAAQRIAVTHFSTDAFAPGDRHEAWTNRDWPTIGPVFDTRPIEPFHNRSDRFALGPLTVHVADMGGQSYERTAKRVRRDGFNHLVVELTLAGSTVGELAGLNVANGAGGISFSDLSQRHFHRSTDSRTILLTIPRQVAQRGGFDVRALHGATVGADDTSLLRGHLVAIHRDLARLTTTQGDRLATTVLDLLGVTLDRGGARVPAAGRGAEDFAFALEARRLIDLELASPHLTVDWLCARLRIPRSRLYRLFKESGGVQALIRRRRIEQVAAALATPGRRDRLAALAERWGFSDASHLSRAFRERYGVSPGEYRESLGAGTSDPVIEKT